MAKTEPGRYKKTAKDLAFDRERAKLQRQNKDLREELRKAQIQIEADDAVMRHQEELLEEAGAEIKKLKALIGIPEEDLTLILNDAKKTAEAADNIKKLLSIGSVLGY